MIIEDDVGTVRVQERVLRRNGYQVAVADRREFAMSIAALRGNQVGFDCSTVQTRASRKIFTSSGSM